MKCRGGTTNVWSCLFRLILDGEKLRTQVSTGATYFVRGTYPNLVEYHPLTLSHLEEQCSESIREQSEPFRTFHNRLYATHKAVDYTQGLCNSYSSLLLGQSIQSLENSLYLALPQ
jgi:hypothetical protein